MALKLYSYAGDFRALKALIAGKYNGIEIETPEFKMGEDNVKPEFIAKNPLGRVPLLETPKGCVFESNAIARYVARMRADTELCGRTFFDSGLVDAWVDFTAHEIELPATMWVFPVLGYLEDRPELTEKSVEELRAALKIVESHLAARTFLVGERITLADIVLACALFYPMKLVLDPEFRAPFPHLVRWFNTCVNQPQFKAVMGEEVPLCATRLFPAGGAAPAAKPKAGKKGKGKEGKGKAKEGKKGKKEGKKAAAAAKPAAPKKAAKPKHPLDELPKSPLDLEEWKRCYSNSRGDYYKSMDWFWENMDKEGYSIWIASYNYNAENEVGFMTSNLVAGFLQRSDAVRKYAFGSMAILNADKPFEIKGAWLMRGHEIKYMLECNPDAEYYTWTKIEEYSEAEKQMIADLWCAEEKVGDQDLYDSKIFK
jgi:elongation factor 1-gamma